MRANLRACRAQPGFNALKRSDRQRRRIERDGARIVLRLLRRIRFRVAGAWKVEPCERSTMAIAPSGGPKINPSSRFAEPFTDIPCRTSGGEHRPAGPNGR